jgi:hypothetical protein
MTQQQKVLIPLGTERSDVKKWLPDATGGSDARPRTTGLRRRKMEVKLPFEIFQMAPISAPSASSGEEQNKKTRCTQAA